ncbi:MAG: hypothetical protein J2P57_17650 [Acidimicrobiaceae bacterium]|nr:hypothetical protein [Acidimicrobiaceae bacterium]
MVAVVLALGALLLFSVPAAAADGQPATGSGTITLTTINFTSTRTADGNTFIEGSGSGTSDGILNGPWTETDQFVIGPDGKVTDLGFGVQNVVGLPCKPANGYYHYRLLASGTSFNTLSGQLEIIDQAANTVAIQGIFAFTPSGPGQWKYSGTYRCG